MIYYLHLKFLVKIHFLVAALAGDEESKLKLREHITEVPVDEPDYTPPENEFIVLDADSSQQWAINSALKGQNLVIEGPWALGKVKQSQI